MKTRKRFSELDELAWMPKDCRFLSRREEVTALRLAKRGDTEARDLLMRSVLPWALQRCKRWLWSGVPIEDLMQLASIGVLEAIGRLEPNLGRLTTYATHYVDKELRLGVRNRLLIRVPIYQDESAGPQALLNSMVGSSDDEDEMPLAVVANNESEALEREEALTDLRIAIDALPRREQFVIRQRLAGDTLLQVGEKLNLTREMIRQIEASARRRLRNRLRSHSPELEPACC